MTFKIMHRLMFTKRTFSPGKLVAVPGGSTRGWRHPRRRLRTFHSVLFPVFLLLRYKVDGRRETSSTLAESLPRPPREGHIYNSHFGVFPGFTVNDTMVSTLFMAAVMMCLNLIRLKKESFMRCELVLQLNE